MSETATQTLPNPNQEPPATAEGIADRIDAHDPERLQGLIGMELTFAMDLPSSSDPTEPPIIKRYVLRDIETVTVPTHETVRDRTQQFPLYWRGGNFPTLDPTLKIGWREKYKPGTKRQTLFVLDKFGPDRDDSQEENLEDILVYTGSDLKKLVGEAADISLPEAPEEPEAAEQPAAHRLNLHLSGDEKDPFSALSEQLEARNIYKWDTLSWTTAITDVGTGKTTVRTKEVVREELADQAPGITKPLRTFVVRELDEEGKQIGYTVMRDDALAEELKRVRRYTKRHKADRRRDKRSEGVIRDIYIELPEELASDRADKPEDQAIASQLAEAATAREEDARGALISLLSSSDVLVRQNADMLHEYQERLEGVKKSEEGKRRIKALEELVQRYGMEAVYLFAARLRNTFEDTARKLDLPTEFTDLTSPDGRKVNGHSVSWVLESLADRHYYHEHPHDPLTELHHGVALGDPFVHLAGTHGTHPQAVAQALRIEHEIMDQQVGIATIAHTVQKVQTRPKLKGMRGNQPVYAPDERILFNDTPLMKFPALNRAQIGRQAEEISEDLKKKRVVLPATLVALGRQVGRAIGR